MNRRSPQHPIGGADLNAYESTISFVPISAGNRHAISPGVALPNGCNTQFVTPIAGWRLVVYRSHDLRNIPLFTADAGGQHCWRH
ncbi:MAG TPA: hypothetical protein VJX31_00730, partial [Casimicrobiaceae bacterium]|nr:hypothetical protein [Casimicrobiaceae bacterium]